jgi:cysteine desulfurase / selenocysteine lyase
MTPDHLRDQFPIVERGVYCNHAAMAPWPVCTAEAVQRFAAENAQLGPAHYAQWIKLENELREQLARLIGASSSRDIALLKNTTEGISTVAWGLDWMPGDNMVLPAAEFPSNRLPWLAQAERGVEIREVDIRSPAHAESALLEAVDARTRLLAVSAVQWNDGFRLDLHALGAFCKVRGVLFFVDAIQQLGALRIDVQACHISFLAADAHKWLLGPEGIAVFYSSADARPLLRLRQLGWHMFDQPFSFGRSEWTPADSARRFEAGSPNTLGQVALQASLGLLLATGPEQIERRVLANSAALLEGLTRIPGIQVVSRVDVARRSGIVSFRSGSAPANRLHTALMRAGVTSAVRDEAIRLSPHFYQGDEETGRVLAAVQHAVYSSGSG